MLTSLIGRRWYVCFRARVVATLVALVALGVAWRHADLLQERLGGQPDWDLVD